MNIDNGNLFASLPGDARKEVFTVLAQGEGVKIERIISRGQSSPTTTNNRTLAKIDYSVMA